MNSSEKIPMRGWLILSCAWIMLFINGFSQLGLGIMLPYMREQFGFGLEVASALTATTSTVQLFTTIPLALLATKTNPRNTVGFIFFMSTLSFFLIGFATHVSMLYVGRACLSVALGSMTSNMARVKTSWVPLSRIARINGMDSTASTSGQFVGTTLAVSLITLLGSWQNLLRVAGVIGAAVTVCWFLLYRSQPDNAAPAPSSANTSLLASLKEAVAQKCVWLLAFGFTGTTLVWIAFTNFWPTYATENLGLDISQAGTITGMIPVGAITACITAPTLARLIGYDKLMMWPWGLYLCVTYYLGLCTSNPTLLSILFFLSGFGAFAFVPIAHTVLFKLGTMTPAAITLGTSIINTLANLGGTLAGVLVGKLAQVCSLRETLTWCCLAPLLWFFTTIFLPELGWRKQQKLKQAV